MRDGEKLDVSGREWRAVMNKKSVNKKVVNLKNSKLALLNNRGLKEKFPF